MRNYWSCSKFADWLRGIKKPVALGMDEWKTWETTTRDQSPFRYWLAEVALDRIERVIYYIPDKIDHICYSFRNRFITKPHAFTAHPRDIKPGNWCDLSNRFVPCLFNELVNFVEVEKAYMSQFCSKEIRSTIPWYCKLPLIRRFIELRSSKLGLDYLDWEINLKYDEDWGVTTDNPLYGKITPQAEAATKIKELYLWFTEVYKNRPDPYDESGWSNDTTINVFDRKVDENAKHYYDRIHEIEAAYDKEDTEKLIELIKIRHSLWT